MKIVSLNVGCPRQVVWHGHTVSTGIFKQSVEGPVALRKLNLDGDRQADLSVHGGEHKAVYCYPIEHYAYWKRKFADRDLPPGSFGENFTTEGLFENEVRLGDQFAVGTAEVLVTQPRLPCYKLGLRFESDDIVRKFLVSRRVGFYLAVTQEGQVQAGEEIKLVSRDPEGISIAAFVELYVAKNWSAADITEIRRLFELPSLPNDWKSYFDQRLQDTHRSASEPGGLDGVS